MTITLTSELTSEDGRPATTYSHPVLGRIATIMLSASIANKSENGGRWYVRPYAFPIYQRAAQFDSLAAAECYTLALAHEMHEQG